MMPRYTRYIVAGTLVALIAAVAIRQSNLTAQFGGPGDELGAGQGRCSGLFNYDYCGENLECNVKEHEFLVDGQIDIDLLQLNQDPAFFQLDSVCVPCFDYETWSPTTRRCHTYAAVCHKCAPINGSCTSELFVSDAPIDCSDSGHYPSAGECAAACSPGGSSSSSNSCPAGHAACGPGCCAPGTTCVGPDPFLCLPNSSSTSSCNAPPNCNPGECLFDSTNGCSVCGPCSSSSTSSSTSSSSSSSTSSSTSSSLSSSSTSSASSTNNSTSSTSSIACTADTDCGTDTCSTCGVPAACQQGCTRYRCIAGQCAVGDFIEACACNSSSAPTSSSTPNTSSSSSIQNQCPTNFCQQYGSIVCPQGQTCLNQPSGQSACYTCIGSSTSSTSSNTGQSSSGINSSFANSSSTSYACANIECALFGNDICAATNQACQNTTTSPCFQCIPSSSSSNGGGNSSSSNGGGNSSSSITGQSSSSSQIIGFTYCGDGITQFPEECDDGNTDDYDGCSYNCFIEECVDDNDCPNGEICIFGECHPTSSSSGNNSGVCGNGILEFPEECDDGNITGLDGCSFDCQLEECTDDFDCPNGVCVNGQCQSSSSSNGNGNNSSNSVGTNSSQSIFTNSSSSACTNNNQCPAGQVCQNGTCGPCTNSAQCPINQSCNNGRCSLCGNGFLDSGEQCDDGNTFSNDGCSSFCTYEGPGCTNDADCAAGRCINGSCYPCITDDECSFGRCINNTCQLPTLTAATSLCGNGIKEQNEECDDANTRDNDGCTSTCLLEVGICGDGIVQRLLGEQCEPSVHPSTLTFQCISCRFVSSSCGNGTLDQGEECDLGDSNSQTPDAPCRTDCSRSRCGDGVIDTAEACDDGNNRNNDGCSRTCQTENGIPTQVASAFTPQTITFPTAFTTQNIPFSLPTASVFPLIQNQAPIGDTGPAAVAVLGAGAASGIAWVRRKRRKK